MLCRLPAPGLRPHRRASHDPGRRHGNHVQRCAGHHQHADDQRNDGHVLHRDGQHDHRPAPARPWQTPAAAWALIASTGIRRLGQQHREGGNLAAATSTGGVFINNSGALTVGFASDPVHGIKEDWRFGYISVTASGTISVTTNAEIIQGPGKVTVTANGASSNVVTVEQRRPRRRHHFIWTTATVTAGQDILVGGSGTFGDIDGGLAAPY